MRAQSDHERQRGTQEAQEDVARFRELRRTQDGKMRDAMVLKYQPLAEKIARKYVSSGEPIEDLIQEAYVGLIKAVDRFNPDQGVQFNTYATHTISGEIRHYLRDLSKIIQEPGWHAQLRYRVLKCHEELQQKLGRQPTPSEIASALDMQEQAVRAVLESGLIFQLDSLDAPEDDSDEAGDTRADRVKAPRDRDSNLEDRVVLRHAINRLKKLERNVIYAFFYQEYSKTEIARRLGISVNYASYLVKRGLRNMKIGLASTEEKESQLRVKALERQIADVEGRLKHVETIDQETGLVTRRQFVSRLRDEVKRASRYKLEFSVIAVRLKLPPAGSPAGRLRMLDGIARAMRRAMRKSSREVDVLARYDELLFTALLPHTGPTGQVVGERIAEFVTGDADLNGVTVDWRIASYPQDQKTAEALVAWIETM